MREKFAIPSLSLIRKIWIAISLITLIPLIILFYYFSGYKVTVLATAFVTFLVFLGWWVIFEVFSSIVRIHSNSREALEEIGEGANLVPDEVKNLESLISLLSTKVKTSFDQLKEFGEKTDELNKEVSKKVFVLSSILQANDLFSKGAPTEEIVQLLVENLKNILIMKACFCSMKIDGSGRLHTVSSLGVSSIYVDGIVDNEKKKIASLKKTAVLDKEDKFPDSSTWAQSLKIKNIAVSPIFSRGEMIGLIGMGNNEDDFIFGPDELDVLNLFAQNIALLWEHRRLSVKVEELEVFDYLTGLYNEKFMASRLEEEIKRSTTYQRPCGYLLMEIKNYNDYQKEHGVIEAERILKKAANTFKEVARPIDIVGRIGANRLAAILIERNKRQSEEVAKRLKKKLEPTFEKTVNFAFSVSESPLDGTTAQELIKASQSKIST